MEDFLCTNMDLIRLLFCSFSWYKLGTYFNSNILKEFSFPKKFLDVGKAPDRA